MGIGPGNHLAQPARSAARRSSRSATGHSPKVGSRFTPRPPNFSASPSRGVAASASGWAPPSAASKRRGTRSQGKNGVSPATVTMLSAPCSAAQSNPASTPARGPGKPAMLSGSTGSAVPRRAASPLALIASPATCGSIRSITRDIRVCPATASKVLSPPPIRVASPPARITPRGCFMRPPRRPCGGICGCHRGWSPGPHRGSAGFRPQGRQSAARASARSASAPPGARFPPPMR